MSDRHRIIRYASIGAYFIVAFALLYWFGGRSYFCRDSSVRSTFRLSVACTIWDLVACAGGSLVAQKMMNLRTAAPLLAAAITVAGLATMPGWLYRGYGHFLFEGTAIDVSCFFDEGYGLAFPVVVALPLGLLTLAHCILRLRTREEKSVVVVR